MRDPRRRSNGQTATEYMLVVSVIVIAVVGAAFVFVAPFREGVEELGRDVSQVLGVGDIGGVGRGGSTANALSPALETNGGGNFTNPGLNDGTTTLANGGFSGMAGRPPGGEPLAANNAPPAPSGAANGGTSSTPP